MAAQWPSASSSHPSVAIRSSLELTAADVAELEQGLVGQRNRFVSLQLVTMVRELVSKNLAAAASGDDEWLRQAGETFLATISCGASLVGGALFYPRPPKQASKPADEAVSLISLTVRAGPNAAEGARAPAEQIEGPTATQTAVPQGRGTAPRDCTAGEGLVPPAQEGSHVYIDLLVINAPRQGFGAALLRQVEAFIKANAQELGRRQGQITEAVPSHPLSDSRAAAGALAQQHLDWRALDASFAALTQQPQPSCDSLELLLEGLGRQLEELASQAGLPSKDSGLFAFLAHEIGRLESEGLPPRDCLQDTFQVLGAMLLGERCWLAGVISVGTALTRTWAHHQRDIIPVCPANAFLLSLAKRMLEASSTPLPPGTCEAGGTFDATRSGRLQWAGIAMSCTYLLASQVAKSLPAQDPTRKLVWESLVPAAFNLMGLARCCHNVPNTGDWHGLVRPALLLSSLQRQLLEGLGLQEREADALKLLDKEHVIMGLVALMARLSLWYHPHGNRSIRASLGFPGSSDHITDAEQELEAVQLKLEERWREIEDARQARAALSAAPEAACSSGFAGGEGEGREPPPGEIARQEQASAEFQARIAGAVPLCEELTLQMERTKARLQSSGAQVSLAAALEQVVPTADVPQEQVGHALHEVASALCSLLHLNFQGRAFITAAGVGMCLEHIQAYADWLESNKDGVVAGDDLGHAIVLEVANCLVGVMRGKLQEDAHREFQQCEGMIHVLDALDALPPPMALLKDVQQGRRLAWSAKRMMLKLIEAVLVGRDFAKADFLEQGGFDSVWACTQLSLQEEEEVRLLNASPGMVRGLLGNALSAISSYAACNFNDEFELSNDRLMELVSKLGDTTSLEELVTMLGWQPIGHDDVQTTLEADQAGTINSVHGGVLRLVSYWAQEESGEILDALAGSRYMVYPFLDTLMLPEAHYMANERAISISLNLLARLAAARPDCISWLLDEGAVPAILGLLYRRFHSVLEEETKLHSALRLSARVNAQWRKEMIDSAKELYKLVVSPHTSVISGGCTLLARLLQDICVGPAACVTLVRERQADLLVRLLRKAKFSDTCTQKHAQFALSIFKFVNAVAEQQSRANQERLEAEAAQTATELLAEERREKERAASKAARQQRQREKARQREEQQREARRVERERREAEGRERRAREEEEQRQRRERAAEVAAAEAARQGQRMKKGKKKNKLEAAAAAPGTPPRCRGDPPSGQPLPPSAAVPLIPALLPGLSGGEGLLPASLEPAFARPSSRLLTPPVSPGPLPAPASGRLSPSPVDEQDSEFQELLCHLLPGMDFSGVGTSPAAPQRAQEAAPTALPHSSGLPSSGAATWEEEGEEDAGQALEALLAGSCSPALLATLRCPLSMQLIDDPVVAADGVSYQRSAMEGWLATGNLHSPATGQQLGHSGLRVNHALRQLLESLADL